LEIKKYLKNSAKDNLDLQIKLIKKELKRASQQLDNFEL